MKQRSTLIRQNFLEKPLSLEGRLCFNTSPEQAPILKKTAENFAEQEQREYTSYLAERPEASFFEHIDQEFLERNNAEFTEKNQKALTKIQDRIKKIQAKLSQEDFTQTKLEKKQAALAKLKPHERDKKVREIIKYRNMLSLQKELHILQKKSEIIKGFDNQDLEALEKQRKSSLKTVKAKQKEFREARADHQAKEAKIAELKQVKADLGVDESIDIDKLKGDLSSKKRDLSLEESTLASISKSPKYQNLDQKIQAAKELIKNLKEKNDLLIWDTPDILEADFIREGIGLNEKYIPKIQKLIEAYQEKADEINTNKTRITELEGKISRLEKNIESQEQARKKYDDIGGNTEASLGIETGQLEIKAAKAQEDYIVTKEALDVLDIRIGQLKSIKGQGDMLKIDDKPLNPLQVRQKRELVRDYVEHVEEKLFTRETEPRSPKVREFIIYAYLRGDKPSIKPANYPQILTNLSQALKGEEITNSEPFKAETYEAFLKYDKTRHLENVADSVQALHEAKFEIDTNVDLNKTKVKFLALYKQAEQDSPLLKIGTWDQIDQDLLSQFVITKGEKGSKIDNLMDFAFLQDYLQKAIEQDKTNAQIATETLEYQNADDYVDKAFNTFKKMLMSNNQKEIIISGAILLFGIKFLMSGSDTAKYARYAAMILAGNEFTKKAYGVDLFEKAGLKSTENIAEGSYMQAQIDRFQRKEDLLNPDGWQKEAMESSKKVPVISAMNSIEIADLLEWHDSIKSLDGKGENTEKIIMQNMPPRLRSSLSNIEGEDELKLAITALGLFELTLKDIAHRDTGISNVQSGKESVQKWLEDAKAFAPNQTFGDILSSNIKISDMEASVEIDRTWADMAVDKGAPYLKDARDLFVDIWDGSKESLPNVIDKLKSLFNEDFMPVLYQLKDQGYRIGKDIIDNTKDTIVFHKDKFAAEIQMVQDRVVFIAKSPLIALDFTINTTQEHLPTIIETVRHFTQNYIKGWVDIGTKELEKEVNISTGKELYEALENMGISEKVQSVYGFIRQEDLMNFCDKIVKQGSFGDLVNQFRAEDADDYDVSQNISHKEIKKLFVQSFFGIPKLAQKGINGAIATERGALEIADISTSVIGKTAEIATDFTADMVTSMNLSDNIGHLNDQASNLIQSSKLDYVYNITNVEGFKQVRDLIQEAPRDYSDVNYPWTYENFYATLSLAAKEAGLLVEERYRSELESYIYEKFDTKNEVLILINDKKSPQAVFSYILDLIKKQAS